MIKTRTAVAIVVIIVLTGCESVPRVGHPDVLRVSASPPPEWITKLEPNASQGYLYFVGRSSGTASERLALDQAREDVTQQILEYLGGYAQRDFEQRRVSLNLESATLDPTIGAKDFRQFAYNNFVSQVRATESYWEYRRTPGGDQYFGYALVPFPINQSMKAFAEQQISDAQKRVRDAQNDQAKKQAQDVVDFWEQTRSVFEKNQ